MNTQLQKVIEILEETARQFNQLEHEAETLLYEQRDTKAYVAKLKKRAQLLVTLPDRLSQTMESLEEKIREKILYEVEIFVELASRALEANCTFSLQALLTYMGDEIDDPNDLEKLVAWLKEM